MQTELRFPKAIYSEWVIRNSLYWMSSQTEWTLEHTLEEWVVCTTNSEFECKAQLHRYLNDYSLREKIMLKTSAIRDAITFNVLSNIENKLNAK